MKFRFPLLVLSSLALVSTAACATSPADDVPGSGAALSGNKDASACEVFVDKVTVRESSRSLNEYKVFLKTLNSKLDGEIARVGFTAKVHDEFRECEREIQPPGNPNGCEEVGKWQDYEATPFVGSSDYFELALSLGTNDTIARRYEGTFFVETKKGTRYSLKANGGGNFFLDRKGFSDVENALSSKGVSWVGAEVGQLPKTADFYTYLNPKECR